MERALVFSLLFIAVRVVTSQNQARFPILTTPITAEVHYLARGVHFKLKCQTDGDDATYKWLRNGAFLMPPGDGNIKYNSSTGDLTLHNFHHEMGGDYICVATIRGASTMSQIQTMKESRFTKFNDKAERAYTADEYAYVNIKCSDQGEIVSDKSDINYNWFFGEETSQVPLNDRLFIDEKGTLHFTYAKKSDETDNNKKYICGYASKKVRQFNLGNTNKLTITHVADPVGSAPTLMYSNNGHVTGLVGSEVNLECFFAGYNTGAQDSLPTIKWFDNRQEITNSDKFKLSQKNRVLTVKNLVENDDKNYFCQGFTTSGNTAKHPVHLNVTSLPIWVTAPQTVTRPAKRDAVFHCHARSASYEAEPSEPVWYINAKKVGSDLDNQKFIFSDDKKTLTIKKLKKPEDIMCVQCMVTNSIGTLMGDACLNVVSPIVISEQPPDVQHIKRGDIVQLTVKATADVQSTNSLTYEWTFNNETYTIGIKAPPFVTYNPMLGITYIITSMGKLNERDYGKIGGLYTCRIFNQFDSKTIETYVVLKDVVPDLKSKVNEKCQQTQRWKSCRENIMERLEDLERRMTQMEQKLKPKTSAEPAILTLTSQIKRLSSRLNGMCSFDDE